MIKWLTAPQSHTVAHAIDCYWLLDKLVSATENNHPKLNPDPSAHLILSSPNHVAKYNINNRMVEVKGSHWLYPYCKTIVLDHSEPFSCLGIKFHVGALYAINPKHVLVNTVSAVNFQQLIGDETITEAQLISKAKNTPDACCQALDALFKPWLDNANEDKHSKLVKKLLPLLACLPINELSDSLACSQRTLERSFLRVTGLSLKQCQAMNKLEAVLTFLYQRKSSEIDWAAVAYQFGFSDQPHLIRYLKKHINLTPNAYVAQRDFTIDVYGGVVPK